MTCPTPEQIKQIAIECGAIFDYRQFNVYRECYIHGFETKQELQAFFTRAYELGWKNRGEAAADTMDNIARTIANMLAANAEAIRNNTGE